MKYQNIERARFLTRPNRFTAHVETERGFEICHVKNTGRCAELLVEGAEIFVERTDSPSRKTSLDLISVMKSGRIVNIDSQAPNKAAYEFMEKGGLFGIADVLKKEVVYGNSRFDLYAEQQGRKAFIEVKGVTLFSGEYAVFPDAPTERGLKHLLGLEEAVKNGFDAYIMFIVQGKGARYVRPNAVTHPAFAEELKRAVSLGVHAVAYDCECTEDAMSISSKLEVVC